MRSLPYRKPTERPDSALVANDEYCVEAHCGSEVTKPPWLVLEYIPISSVCAFFFNAHLALMRKLQCSNHDVHNFTCRPITDLSTEFLPNGNTLRGKSMNWRHDSTVTNLSLLSEWVYGVIRPIVRIMRSAGVSEASLLESVKRASLEHDGDKKKGRLGSGSRYESLLELASVTAAWARSSAWTDGAGQPRELAMCKEDPKGFVALVRSVNPRLNPTAVMKELQSMDAVRILAGGSAVRLLRPSVVNTSEDTFSVEPVLRDLQRFAETLENHVFRGGWIAGWHTQMTAARLSIDPAKFEDFCRFVARNGQMLLDSADDRLNSYSEVADGAGANYGVGVFVFLENAPLVG